MKITKLVHSCLLVETADDTTLIDPGIMSRESVLAAAPPDLHAIVITHDHPDHMDVELIKKLVGQYGPETQVIAPASAAQQLQENGIDTVSEPTEYLSFFESPHEHGEPVFSTPEQRGIHYRGKLTHPGDSHSFEETKDVLALPVTAPWGATVTAVNLAIRLKPKYVIPIHDWHWSDEARDLMYENLRKLLARDGIEFVMVKNGEPFELLA